MYIGVGWGFDDASRTFFNKSAGSLTLEEAALLAGLLPSPNGHDPCQFPQRALEARNKVLNKMIFTRREGQEGPLYLSNVNMERETLSLPAFSLNWVILFNHPILATQLNIQAPSACAATLD